MKADETYTMTVPEPRLLEFVSGPALAETLSDRVAEALRSATETYGEALLAVSGGSTPKLFFQALSQRKLPWDRVTVTLVDERFVPPAHERSNHRLLATHLLQNEAALARFMPLYGDDGSPADAALRAAERMRQLGRPLDVAVLGMGLDGHTASWFPESPQLATCVDPSTQETVVAAEAPGAGEPRLTLTLPVIAAAAMCILHIEGTDKKHVYNTALEPGPVERLPVRAVLRKAGTPLQVYWAP